MKDWDSDEAKQKRKEAARERSGATWYDRAKLEKQGQERLFEAQETPKESTDDPR